MSPAAVWGALMMTLAIGHAGVASSAQDSEQPALAPALGPQAAGTEEPEIGTVIIGDQESAVGLYLMPWKDESAADMKRPPGLTDFSAEPLDEADFRRQSDYYESATAFRLSKRERKR